MTNGHRIVVIQSAAQHRVVLLMPSVAVLVVWLL
jgi:hypothetical protein